MLGVRREDDAGDGRAARERVVREAAARTQARERPFEVGRHLGRVLARARLGPGHVHVGLLLLWCVGHDGRRTIARGEAPGLVVIRVVARGRERHRGREARAHEE